MLPKCCRCSASVVVNDSAWPLVLPSWALLRSSGPSPSLAFAYTNYIITMKFLPKYLIHTMMTNKRKTDRQRYRINEREREREGRVGERYGFLS